MALFKDEKLLALLLLSPLVSGEDISLECNAEIFPNEWGAKKYFSNQNFYIYRDDGEWHDTEEPNIIFNKAYIFFDIYELGQFDSVPLRCSPNSSSCSRKISIEVALTTIEYDSSLEIDSSNSFLYEYKKSFDDEVYSLSAEGYCKNILNEDLPRELKRHI